MLHPPIAAQALRGTLALVLLALPLSTQAEEPPARFASNRQAPSSNDVTFATFDYLYVEANQGTSSGGHVAIRFGDRVYHFRNRDGMLVLDRERFQDFVHAYARLENRTIHLSRVALPARAYRRVREQFRRQRQAQARQLDVLAALREDRELAERWFEDEEDAESSGGEVDVASAGYFAPSDPAPGNPNDTPQISQALVRLRERIVVRYGATILQRRRERQREEFEKQSRADLAGWLVELPGEPYQDSAPGYSVARRRSDAAAGLVALDVLERAPPLRDGSFREPTSDRYRLSADEKTVLDAFSESLTEDLVRLLASPREDWGRVLLIGMARLAALDRSRVAGRWVLLDLFPEDAQRIDAPALSGRAETLRGMQAELETQLARARSAFRDRPGEREWTRFERAANRAHELETALRAQRGPRLVRGRLAPTRSAGFVAGTPLRRTADERAGLRTRTRARERAYRERLALLHRYRLASHNCVSEIFASLNRAFADSPDPVKAATEAFGGYVDGRRLLDFIPFRSAAAVNGRLRVIDRQQIPSFRERQLQEMNEREQPLLVALRESNTLTAASYPQGERDSFFLFFTDDTVALRPLFGAVNLLAGIGESLLGLVLLPIDRGETLRKGLRGSAASLPELAFGNIRKGSNDWLPREPAAADPF